VSGTGQARDAVRARRLEPHDTGGADDTVADNAAVLPDPTLAGRAPAYRDMTAGSQPPLPPGQ
jgi:hypothetical protein